MVIAVAAVAVTVIAVTVIVVAVVMLTCAHPRMQTSEHTLEQI